MFDSSMNTCIRTGKESERFVAQVKPNAISALPRNRTPSCRFVVCHANPAHPQGKVSRPGIEPGSGPSEGPMRSIAPSRLINTVFRPGVEPGPGSSAALCNPLHYRDILFFFSEPTTGIAPVGCGLQDHRLAVRPRWLSFYAQGRIARIPTPLLRPWRPLALPGGHAPGFTARDLWRND